MIAGADAPHRGEAKNSWLTGTAAWTFVNVSQYILGITPDWNGLKVNPCIPSWLGNFSIHRTFRNAEYDIQVENPGRVEKGIVSMTVDGKTVEGCIIPFEEGKKHYDVKVVMG